MHPALLNGEKYLYRRIDTVTPVPCPCGSSTRIVTRSDTAAANLHVTAISEDSRLHYHARCMEIYHVLEGSGVLEIAGDTLDMKPGDTVVIPPLTKHRASGRLKILIVGVPAFDPADEYFD
ncbi:MAG: cupin domain-containing protein [Planctomycetes bacterium]|nr:cupin domain-containing protein [Planctomycetota bacterium]